MTSLREVLSEATKISGSIKSVLKQSTYSDYDDMSGLKIDYADPDELMLLEELRTVMDRLEDTKNRIDYLNKPVTSTGTLSKNEAGRYELSSEIYYTCGYDIEFLLDKNNNCNVYESDVWVKTRVGYDGDHYYLVGYKGIRMDGLKARARCS